MTTVTILQMMAAGFCTASAIGVLLVALALRATGALRIAPEGSASEGAAPLAAALEHAVADRSYLLASALCSLGALAAFPFDRSIFFLLTGTAASFLMAETILLPRLRDAVAAAAVKEARAYRGVRTRFEMVMTFALLLIFVSISAPPLAQLARVYGL